MNKTFAKIIALVLCCVLVVGVFAGCKKTNEALDKHENDIKTNAAALAELKGTVTQLQAAAELYATAEALNKVVDDLTADKADLTAAKEQLETIKTTLNTLATTEALDGVKANLKTLTDDLAALADVALTAEDIAGKADQAALDQAIADLRTELQDYINGAVDMTSATNPVRKYILNMLGSYMTMDQWNQFYEENLGPKKGVVWSTMDEKINAAKNELKSEIKNVSDKLDAFQEDVEADLKDINDKLADLEDSAANAANKEELAAAKAELNTLKQSNDLLNGYVTTLKNQVATLEKQIADLESANVSTQDFINNFELATKVLNGDVKLTVDEDGNITVDENGKSYSLAEFTAIWDAFEAIENYYIDEDYEAVKALYEDLYFFLGRAVSAEAIVGFFNQFNEKIENLPSLAQVLAQKVGAYYSTTEGETVVPAAKYLAANNEATDDDLGAIIALRAQITSVSADDSVTPELQADYEALVAAYEYLEQAEDDTVVTLAAINTVTAIGKVIYVDSDTSITAATDAVNLVASTWFATAEEGQPATEYDTHKVFFADGEGVATVVTNYETYTAALARQEQLVDAFDNKITVAIENVYDATEYDTVKPLWSYMAKIDEKVAEFDAWCDEYEINVTDDATSITNMYGNHIDLLNKADAYATAMNTVYTTTVFAGINDTEITGVAALNELTAALCAKDVVLFADYAEFIAYETAYGETLVEAAEAALGAEYTYDSAAANFLAMITEELNDAFMADLARVKELSAANDELDAIYDAMVALVNANLAIDAKKPVTFKDSYAIKAWEAEIAEIYADADVEIGDANFIEIEKVDPATDKLAELKADYENLVKAIRQMYDEITAALGEDGNVTKMSLTLGLRLGAYNALLDTIPTDTVDINLNLDDDDNKVTLADLTRKLAEANTAYKNLAAEAQTAAATVIAQITNADYVALTTTTLNNYAAIVAVRDALNTWLETYILNTKYATAVDANGIPTEYATVADLKADTVKAALAAIANVPVAGTAGAQKYAFVTVENYEYCMTKYDAIIAFRDLADADWAELEAQFAPLTDTATQTPSNNIHNLAAYAAVDFLTYINTYYGELDDMANVATVVLDAVNDEIDAYTAFKASWDACVANDSVAGTKRGEIHNSIIGLAAPEASNYATILTDVANIRTLIADYYEHYCPNQCADCITDADLLLLEKRAAVAEVVKYAEEVVRVHANAAANAKIDETVDYWTVRINDYANADVDAAIAKVIDFIGQAKEQFNLDHPCLVAVDPLNPADVHTYGDDCVCDFCDYKKPCVDTVKDHECDVCGLTTEFPACEDSTGDGDHVCDYCGIEKTTCADADADGDHKCDECGADNITACEDATADGDHKCDECGADNVTDHVDADTDNVCDECTADLTVTA
ncbi:MAG: hypothetical protein IKA64_01675 [Clostridia bacterium]|nr:hypothetical protein [Clostridia bacterium]